MKTSTNLIALSAATLLFSPLEYFLSDISFLASVKFVMLSAGAALVAINLFALMNKKVD